MCFELVELDLENSLFLLKTSNDRINARNQQGSRSFPQGLRRETHSRPQEYLHFI